MTESHGPPVGKPGWPEPGDLTGLRDLVIRHIVGAHQEHDMDDRAAEQLANRVSAIEEVFAARWPRRIWLAFRLGRRLRASVRHLGYAGSFTDRRKEIASLAVHPGGQAVAAAAHPGDRGGHRRSR